MASCYGPSCRMPGLPCGPCPMRVRYVGVPKLGPTLCTQGVDQPSPTNALRRVRYRSVTTKMPSMSVGVLQSLFASNDKALYFDDAEMNGQRYAMCLKAFALLHIIPVHKWTRKMLDNLMQEGAELYSQGPDETSRKSGEMAYEREAAASLARNIYNINEQGIRRAFKLEGYEFEVELRKKFSPARDDGASGDLPPDIHIVGLRPALNKFFKKHKFCLLSTSNLYLLIWKDDGVFFVIDFYGRTPNLDLMREGGLATLVCMREIRCVDYLITQKSSLGKKDTFALREMRVIMLVDPEGKAFMSSFDANRADEFVRVTPNYAYLKAKLHLSLQERNPLLSRCGLPVGIAAIITSKIDHPASWDTKTLNKIVCYGFFICQCCWEYCKSSQVPIDYDSFPNQLQIGQFAVNLTILPQIAQGMWRCTPRFQGTDLTKAITKCFDNGYNYLLLTISQQTYAIWKKNGFFYLFDPYRHHVPNDDARIASLRMFGSLEEFLRVLSLVLLQSNTKTTFFIHRVVVTDIRVSLGVECLPSVPKRPSPEDLVEVKSINEGICFREDYKRCWDDLGQLSEEEEEEEAIEEIMEESEKEPPGGEEEGEYDFEDEWTDDGFGGRKRRYGRRGRGKGRGKLGYYGKGGGKGKAGKGGKGGKGGRGGKDGKGGKYGKGGKDGKGGIDADGKGGKGRSRKSRLSVDSRGRRRSRSGSRGSKSRGSRSRGSRSRGSRSRDSKSRDSKSRGSRSRGSRSRGSKSRRSKSKRGLGDSSSSSGSRSGSRRSKSRGRGSKSRRSRSRGDDDSYGEGGRRGEKGKAGGDGKGDGFRGAGEKGDGEGGGRGKFDDGKGDGERYGPDGSRYLPDGTRIGPDGTRYLPDGTRIAPDGTRYGPDGARIGPDGARYGPDGALLGPDGARYGPDGALYGSDGTRYGPDGALYGPDGMQYGPDGTRYLPDGTRIGPDGSRYLPDGTRIGPDGTRYGPDGRPIGEEVCYKDKFDEKKSKDDSGLGTAFSQLQDGYGEDDKQEGTVCRPNAYPGYRPVPFSLAVAGSETGTYESLCKLLRAGFKYADRVLTMTPFGNFVVFRGCSMFKKTYFVFDGCTCNVERFRHLDLNYGTAGLICFNSLHCAITYILDTRHIRKCMRKNHAQVVDEICMRYCK